MPKLTDIDHTIDYDEIPLEAFDPNDGAGMSRWITENSIIFQRMLARLKVLGEAYDSLALRLGLKNNVFSLVWYPEIFYYDADTDTSVEFVDYESVGLMEIVEDPITLQYFLKCSGSVVLLAAPHTIEDGVPEENNLDGSYVYVALPAAADLVDGAKYWTGHLSTMFVTVDERGDAGLENFLCGVIGTDGIMNKRCILAYGYVDVGVGYVRCLLPSFFISTSSFNFDLLFPVTEEVIAQIAEEYLAVPDPTPGPDLTSPPTANLVAWYDPSDLSTLWQDTAGTIPVTTHGDPVRRIDDKSGNGWHATSGTGNLYQEDGDKKYLALTANAFLATITDGSIQSQTELVLNAAVAMSGYSNNTIVSTATAVSGTALSLGIQLGYATNYILTYGPGHIYFVYGPFSQIANQPYVYSTWFDGSQVATERTRIRVDGVNLLRNTGSNSNTTTPATNPSYIKFPYNSGVTRFYGLTVYNSLPSDDFAHVEAFFAAKCGVTL